MVRQKSRIWKHFQKIDNETAMCIYCDKKVKTSGNTSNMRGHMTYAHASIVSTKNKEKNASKKRCNSENSSTLKKNNPDEISTSSGMNTHKDLDPGRSTGSSSSM